MAPVTNQIRSWKFRYKALSDVAAGTIKLVSGLVVLCRSYKPWEASMTVWHTSPKRKQICLFKMP